RAGHSDVVPHDAAQLTMDFPNTSMTLDREKLVDPLLNTLGRFREGVVLGCGFRKRSAGKGMGDRVGDAEIAVGKALHQGTRSETIGSVVREVRFAQDV